MGQFAGPTDPSADAHWHVHEPRKGFFTDTSICIGCKACEVACKEWNRNPRDGDLELLGMSYDNTGSLGASTWRHVAFIEQGHDQIEQARESGRALPYWSDPRFTGFAGGMPLWHEGVVLGAVGVSGLSEDADHRLASELATSLGQHLISSGELDRGIS